MDETTGPTTETLVFRDRSSATMDVTQLDQDHFRIDDPAIAFVFPSLQCHDVVKATRNADGELVVERRVRESGWRTCDFVLPEGWLQRAAVQRILQIVEAEGGQWTDVFGGILIICLPPTSIYDPTQDIRQAAPD